MSGLELLSEMMSQMNLSKGVDTLSSAKRVVECFRETQANVQLCLKCGSRFESKKKLKKHLRPSRKKASHAVSSKSLKSERKRLQGERDTQGLAKINADIVFLQNFVQRAPH